MSVPRVKELARLRVGWHAPRASARATSGVKMAMKAMRPTLAEVERFLDDMELDRQLVRWLLEDLANVEDSPETDAVIEQRKRKHAS